MNSQAARASTSGVVWYGASTGLGTAVAAAAASIGANLPTGIPSTPTGVPVGRPSGPNPVLVHVAGDVTLYSLLIPAGSGLAPRTGSSRWISGSLVRQRT